GRICHKESNENSCNSYWFVRGCTSIFIIQGINRCEMGCNGERYKKRLDERDRTSCSRTKQYSNTICSASICCSSIRTTNSGYIWICAWRVDGILLLLLLLLLFFVLISPRGLLLLLFQLTQRYTKCKGSSFLSIRTISILSPDLASMSFYNAFRNKQAQAGT